jgi:tRNA threonylcarbamoyl adenosine modification protein YeaZ
MNTLLAIEQSTVNGSAVLMSGRTVLAGQSWNEVQARQQQLFARLPELFAAASLRPEAVDLLAVGLGPGVFSGLRTSLSAARALAIPGRRPVYGVSSGEVLAWDTARRTGARSVTVIGDARRHRFWYARFAVAPTRPTLAAPYALVFADAWRSILTPGTVVVTPHWERIGKDLLAHKASAALIEESRMPTAGVLAELVLGRLERNEPTDELSPIYMHPPVFVEPRFS